MSDPDQADQDEAKSGFLAVITHFDWLKIPGAARAIAQLVTGTAQTASAWIDIAQAKGQQTAQRIRDDTGARTKISAAVAKAAAQQAAKTPEILNLAVERFYADQLRQQENRQAVAILASEMLDDDPPSALTEGPSVDWLNVFSSHAEKASSDVLRQHWAQILAQEIRAPGSFCLPTLLMLSIIDTRHAAAMTRARRWIADDWVLLVGPLGFSPCYDDLLVLDSIGFLRIGSSKSFRPHSADNPIITPYVNTGIAVYGTPREQYQIPGALLTIAGKEMLKIMAAEEDKEMIRHVATALKSLQFSRVQ